MFIPNTPQQKSDRLIGNLPVMWTDTSDRRGADIPWREAPIGSLYFAVVNDELIAYVKDANNGTDADWSTLAGVGINIGSFELNANGTPSAWDIGDGTILEARH